MVLKLLRESAGQRPTNQLVMIARLSQVAQNLYRQDLAFDRTASCRHDGRFHCDCGHSTSKQSRSISHATSAHNAPTPYVCPDCDVCCPRGLYQCNARLREHDIHFASELETFALCRYTRPTSGAQRGQKQVRLLH